MKQDKPVFIPEKIKILDIQLVSGNITTPRQFDSALVMRYSVESSMKFASNASAKLIKSEISFSVKSESNGSNKKEAEGSFVFIFVFQIDNFDELILKKKGKPLEVDARLTSAIASVTYSTCRGLLLSRLQGTVLSSCILPVVNPAALFQSNKKQKN